MKNKAAARERSTGLATSTAVFVTGLSFLAFFNLYWASGLKDERPSQTVTRQLTEASTFLRIFSKENIGHAIANDSVSTISSKSVSSIKSSKLSGRNPLSKLTIERCVQQSDESELCWYDGPMCFDGEEVVVFTEQVAGDDRRTSMCYDFRHYEPSYTCAYSNGFARPPLPGNTEPHILQDVVPGLAGFGNKANTWGPNGKEVRFREAHPHLLTRSGLRAANTSVLWLRPGILDVDRDEILHKWVGPDFPPSMQNSDTDTLPDEGDLASGLYVASFHHSWLDHTWHGAAALMQLWDAKRYNRSTYTKASGHAGYAGDSLDSVWVADFSDAQPGPRQPIRPMGAWRAPPMDHLLFAGNYRPVVGGTQNLMRWLQGLLKIVMSSHTRAVFNTDWASLGVAKNKLLCARRGTVLGYKPRLLTGPADAHAFRLAAYAHARLSHPPKAEWPPRQITLLTRSSSRAIANMEEILQIIKASGLPVRWITEMGTLSYEQQVEAMAGTGILISTHGAALANILYLPAHAVVVEMFPYLLYASMYRDLAGAAGLYYYSLRSARPDAATAPALHEEPFLRDCDGAANFVELRANGSKDAMAAAIAQESQNGVRHVSSSAAFLEFECNWRSKASSLLIRPSDMQHVLSQALDDIGCRDGWCEVSAGKFQRLNNTIKIG